MTVGGEGECVHGLAVTVQYCCRYGPARDGDVPQPNAVVRSARGERPAVGGEGECLHRIRVAFHDREEIGRAAVPDAAYVPHPQCGHPRRWPGYDRPVQTPSVRTCRRHRPAIRAEGHRHQRGGRAGPLERGGRAHGLPGRPRGTARIPQTQGAVRARRREQVAVGTEGEGTVPARCARRTRPPGVRDLGWRRNRRMVPSSPGGHQPPIRGVGNRLDSFRASQLGRVHGGVGTQNGAAGRTGGLESAGGQRQLEGARGIGQAERPHQAPSASGPVRGGAGGAESNGPRAPGGSAYAAQR